MFKILGHNLTKNEAVDKLSSESLIKVKDNVFIEVPAEFNEQWVSALNASIESFALDLAVLGEARELIFAFRTAVYLSPDKEGRLYAYSGRAGEVDVLSELFDSDVIPQHIKDQIKPLKLVTFRLNDLDKNMYKVSSYIEPSNVRASEAFAAIKPSDNPDTKKLKRPIVRITYAGRTLLDNFGLYKSYHNRLLSNDDVSSLMLYLGFKPGHMNSSFDSQINEVLLEGGDSYKLNSLNAHINKLKKEVNETPSNYKSMFVKLANMLRPKGNFRLSGQRSEDSFKECPVRFVLFHNDNPVMHLNLIRKLPMHGKASGYVKERYDLLGLTSGDNVESLLPGVEEAFVSHTFPKSVNQYLPEISAFANASLQAKLASKRVLLSGFSIHPTVDDVGYDSLGVGAIKAHIESLRPSLAARPYDSLIVPEDEAGVLALSKSNELADMVNERRNRNMQYAHLALNNKSPSLAGMQPKVPVYIESSPKGDIEIKPSLVSENFEFTHILKLPVNQSHAADDQIKSGMCISEHVSMSLAKMSGLQAPKFGLVSWPSEFDAVGDFMNYSSFTSEPAYIIERFDLPKNESESFVVQELMALMGAEHKLYISSTPHSVESVAECIKEMSTNWQKDRDTLLRWLIVSEAIGNTDMHLKNIAMLATVDKGNNLVKRELSPIYDILSVEALSPDFYLINDSDPSRYSSLTVNGQFRPSWVDWMTFATGPYLSMGRVEAANKISEIAQQLYSSVKSLRRSASMNGFYNKSKLLGDVFDRSLRRAELGYFILTKQAPALSRKLNVESRSGIESASSEFHYIWGQDYFECVKSNSERQSNVVANFNDKSQADIADLMFKSKGEIILPKITGPELDGKAFHPLRDSVESVSISLPPSLKSRDIAQDLQPHELMNDPFATFDAIPKQSKDDEDVLDILRKYGVS